MNQVQPIPANLLTDHQPSTQEAQFSNLPPYDWRNEFLMDVATDTGSKEYLFELLGLVRGYTDSREGASVVNELLLAYLTSPNEEKNRFLLVKASRLSKFLLELDTVFECFNNPSGYTAFIDGFRKEASEQEQQATEDEEESTQS